MTLRMTCRERILCALEHRQPDVCPWQINPTVDSFELVAHYLGDGSWLDGVGNHMASYEEGWFKEERAGFWRDQFGILWNRTIDKDIGNVDKLLIPEADLGGYQFPEPDYARNAAALTSLVQDNPDRLRVASIGFSMFERAWTLRGMENLLIDMVMNPDFVDALMDRILEYDLAVLEHMLTYDVDCIRFGDDWGQQRGLIMGPRLWRRFIKPRMTVLYSRVKSAGRYVMQHSCGDVQELFPELIDMGLDIFETFQPEVMNVDSCKKEYGHHLTFYGGISTQQVMPRVSPDELYAHVHDMIRRIGQGGGYIVAPTHGVPRDVPPENIMAFVRAVQNQPV